MWKLKPLKGKYYGTIAYNTETGDQVDFWLDGARASLREIEMGWLPMDGMDHVETQESLDAAMIFVDAMNAKEETL